jgi:hypothetical protein
MLISQKAFHASKSIAKQPWSFRDTLLGEFNLLNCLAVVIAAESWGLNRPNRQRTYEFQT